MITNLREEQYYCLILDDYALPGFCSGGKSYYGTLTQIGDFVQSLDEHFQELKDALQDFVAGKMDVTHIVAYNDIEFLQPVSKLKSENLEFDMHQWEHINVWGSAYQMKAEAIEVAQILLQKEDEYIRAIKPVFKNLRYDDKQDEITGFWGFPNMLVNMGNQILCSLFIEVARYDNSKAAMADMGKKNKIDFKWVIDEVFGDG